MGDEWFAQRMRMSTASAPGHQENVTMKDGEVKQLRRQNGIIGGVCGGLGAFFGISAFWFRLLFLLLLLPGGFPGLLPYLLLWLIMPKQ